MTGAAAHARARTDAARARAVALGVALAAGLALWLHARHFDHVADDAYISLRYVDHWLRGQGLVFNPGERVMGFSNPGFVALVAALGALGAPLVGAAQAVGVVASLGCVLAVALALAHRYTSALPAAVGCAWLAASGPFALWTTAGLEGPLFALALLVAALAAEGAAGAAKGAAGAAKSAAGAAKNAAGAAKGAAGAAKNAAGAAKSAAGAAKSAPGAASGGRRAVALAAGALGVAALVRPEGAGYALALAAWLAFARAAVRDGDAGAPPLRAALARGLRVAWPLAAAGVLAWGAVAVAALAYYGDPLPNTYYAKSHPLSLAIVERGALFTWHYLRVHAFAPLVAVALALGVLARRPADPRLASAALLGAFVVWYLRIGGDALVYYRMWAWAQPLVALLLGHAVGALLAPPAGLARRALVAVAAALPLACLPNSFAGFDIAYLRTDDARIRDLGDLGRFLAARAPDATIAANAIGAVGFASRLPVVDMLGLTSARVARAPGKALGVPGHESHDGAWVLDQRPDVVLVGIPRASAAPLPIEQAFQPAFPSDLDLLADPRFRRDYAFGHVQLPDGRFVALFLYRDGALGAAVSAPSGGGAPAP